MINCSRELSSSDLIEIKSLSKQMRRDIVKMVHAAKSGHPGGSLSCVEILATLYLKCLNHCPDWKNDADFDKRDRFVLSKGHASSAFYSVLCRTGYFEESKLLTFRKLGSTLQGHPCCSWLDGVEVSTGSLGQGLSISCGIALGLRLNNNDSYVYTLLGDGELQEGSVWEAFMNAGHHRLNHLIAIIDRNKLQIDGCTEDVKCLEPLADKIEAFGWNVMTIDGHNPEAIFEAINIAKTMSTPTAIIAETIKGKGVSFMENNAAWHGKAPNDEELKQALVELEQL